MGGRSIGSNKRNHKSQYTDCYNFFTHKVLLDQYWNMGNQSSNALKETNNHITKHIEVPNNQADLNYLMGPWKLNFPKLSPKEFNAQDQIITDIKDQWSLSDFGKQKQSQAEIEIEDDDQNFTELCEYSEQIEEIKVKWNSFIKMKEKNYLQEYIVLREIGRGGFGTVSKVKNKYTNVLRAAKKIKKSRLGHGEHQKLLEEMAVMITLDHPNITRLFQVYDYKSSYVLILQLCEGGELFKKIITRSTNQRFAGGVMIQLLNALQYLHAKNIVHRDLKPQNMLFENGSGYLKIIDFGISAKKVDGQPLTHRIGTPYYIAPEVLCKKYDEKCDLWSAGIILYMMLTYRPPFTGDTELKVMQNILRTEPNYKLPIFNDFSKECIDFLKKLLVKNPQKRLSAMEAFKHPWVQKFSKVQSLSDITSKAIDTISTFKFSNRFEAVVYTFIVSQIMTSQEKDFLKKLFQTLDTNHDGVLSKEQFKNALLKRKQLPPERIQFLMRIIDTNSSGQIDFTEFIVAALDPLQFSKEHFQQAFNYFDIDHSGMITYDEIAAFLEDRQNSEEQIKRIFKDVDQNSDGEISKQQFLHILSRKAKENRNSVRNKYKTKMQKKQSIGVRKGRSQEDKQNK